MSQLQGPGSSYELLYSASLSGDPSLSDEIRGIYPGDWQMEIPDDRPYIYSNFAMSRDGRISYNVPGQEAAYYVTKGDPHDRWLMGLLRMRADALMIGDNSIRLEPDFLSTAEHIYPPDAAWYTAQRAADGRAPLPILVILSYSGDLPEDAVCLGEANQHIVMATTTAGVENARNLESAGTIDVLDLGEGSADLTKLVKILYQQYGVRTLLCEGGARVFSNMLDAGLIDAEFVTWCPVFVGRDPDSFRPGYSEGVAWTPETAPYSEPVTIHKAGHNIYLHTRCHYSDGVE